MTYVLDEAQVIDMLVRELKQTGNVVFKNDVRLLWQFYSSKGDIGGFSLQYLYTKVHAANYLLWQYYEAHDTEQLDVVQKESQIFNNLLKLYQIALERLQAETQMSRAGVDIRFGQITNGSPYPYKSLPSLVNPNSLFFRGMPSLLGEPTDESGW